MPQRSAIALYFNGIKSNILQYSNTQTKSTNTSQNEVFQPSNLDSAIVSNQRSSGFKTFFEKLILTKIIILDDNVQKPGSGGRNAQWSCRRTDQNAQIHQTFGNLVS